MKYKYKVNDVVTLDPKRTKKQNLVGFYFTVMAIDMNDGNQILEVVPFDRSNAMPTQYLYDGEVVLSLRQPLKEKVKSESRLITKLMEWCGF